MVGVEEEEPAAVSIGTHCREDERTLRDIVRVAASERPFVIAAIMRWENAGYFCQGVETEISGKIFHGGRCGSAVTIEGETKTATLSIVRMCMHGRMLGKMWDEWLHCRRVRQQVIMTWLRC